MSDMKCDECTNAILSNGKNIPAEVQAVPAHMQVDCRLCECSLELVGEECKQFSTAKLGGANGLIHNNHCQQVIQFILVEPSKLLGLPCPAPPPKLHYSTRWRSIARRMYRANASSRLKKFQTAVQSHPTDSKA